MTDTVAVDIPEDSSAQRRYGRSVMWSGLGAFYRSFLPFTALLAVNALIQGLLILPNPTISGSGAWFWILGIVSYLVAVVALGYAAAIALTSAARTPGFGPAGRMLAARFWPTVLWVVIWSVCCWILTFFWIVPGLVLFLITPYVVLAAVHGSPNPVAANFRAIKQRFGRFLVTLIVQCVIGAVVYILVLLNGYFVQGFPASILYWFIGGWFMCWFLAAWALLFTSTTAGE